MEPLKFIKAEGDELHLEGYLALWGGVDLQDFDTQHFKTETDFESSYTKTGRLLIDWEHGQEPDVDESGKALIQPGRDDILGYVDWLTAQKDDIGLLARHILDRRKKYVKELVEPLAKAELLATSTEAVQPRVKVEDDGWLSRWPLKRQSITVMPAEPRLMTDSQLSIIKSLAEQYPHLKAFVPEAASTTATNDATAGGKQKPLSNSNGEQVMSEINEELVAKIAADAAAAAVKAEREERAAEEKTRADQEAHDKEVAEGAIKAYQKEQPAEDKFGTAANVAEHGDVWKYDNYTAGDLAAALHFIGEAKTRKTSEISESARQRPLMVKALALRLESDEAEDVSKRTGMNGKDIEMPGPLKSASRKMKQSGVKAAEMDTSIASNFGDEWVGVAYGAQVWDEVREQSQIVQRVPSLAFPAGAESMVIPISGGDVPWYTITQATAPGATTRISYTVPQQGVGTGKVTMTLGVLGTSSLYTGMLVEDSIVPFVSELRASITAGGADYLTSALIDGDTSSSSNINDSAGTSDSKEWYLVWDGFRHSCLVTTAANSRDGGVISTSDFLETAKLLGPAGKVGFNRDAVSFIIDPNVHWKALELSDVKTKDIFTGATLEGGMLASVYGYEVIPSYQINFSSTVNGAYAYKTLATGFVDINTDSNNTKGVILAVRWDKWKLGYRRQVTSEVERIPRADSWEITSLLRAGLVKRDTEASAISYNLTV
jgi:hypothetical protein